MLHVTLVGLTAAGRSGIARYTTELVSALDEVAAEFPGLVLRLLTTPAGRERMRVREMALDIVDGAASGQGPRRILAEQVAASRARCDLLHFFDLMPPVLTPRRPFVATLHDAAIRHGFQRLRVAHKHVLQPLAVARARKLVAVSEFAREEGVTRLRADPARVHVVHPGPGLRRVLQEPPPAASAYRGDRYLLYVGNFAAHKNLGFLVTAFTAARLPERLVLVGSWGDRLGDVRAAIAESPARERIELRTRVDDCELERLYAQARALLLPSLYEGFGATALEAMSRNCPVLASDIPAIREVCRNGACLLAPGQQEPWVDAMRRITADDGWRDELRGRGADVAAGYSWTVTARRVCEILLAAGD